MPSKLVEFHKQFMIGAFKIKLNQFEKTASMNIIYISLGNLKIKIHFRN